MLLAGFLLWVVAEIAAAVAVADLVGVLWCVLLLLAGWPLGGWILRAEGRAALRRLPDTLAAGRPPGPGLLDGALALLAGPLFIVPGFVTDALALVLLVPAARRGLGRRLLAHAQSRLVRRAARVARGARREYDVDATARWDGGAASEATPRPRGDRPQLHG
jgi:UPF0716 protein FxsA